MFKKKLWILGCVDVGILALAWCGAILLAVYAGQCDVRSPMLWLPALILLVCYILCFGLLRINEAIWRYSSESDYIKVLLAALLVSGCASLALFFSSSIEMPFPFHLLALGAGSAGVLLSRLAYHWLYNRHRGKEAPETRKRLLIVGAGLCGNMMLTDIRNNPRCGLEPVALVDDDLQKRGRTIGGVTVQGGVADIERICRERAVELIYIAIPSATNAERAHILAECEKTGCKVSILPSFSEIEHVEAGNFINMVRDITPEELLGRDPICVANDDIYGFVSGKTVLVTGGGGSIGSELCRQVAAHRPRRLVIVDIYENNAYEIQQELRRQYGNELDLEVYIASVREFAKLDYLFSVEKPQVVFHAAAHKHVPLMEVSPDEAIKNNVFGTYNTARAANIHGVDKFILISTDKAVNPTNIMGASKRVCEMVIQYFGSISTHTTYAAVRFGNVLGSNGSVIPLFKEQIKAHQDLTVTDPRIIRYFMTIPEAAQLVLAAGAMAGGGEIFVLDMGEPVKIDDLARKMIRLSGLEIGRDINIRYIGLRPGEKLYEELLVSEEGLKKTLNKKIFISSVMPVPAEVMEGYLDELRALGARPGAGQDEFEALLGRIVPTFHRYVPGRVTAEADAEQKIETPTGV